MRKHYRVLHAVLSAGLAACASIQRTPATGPDANIRFDNAANEYVEVYVAAEQRQWRLGRVAPGAKVVLSVPTGELAEAPGFVRLVVVPGPVSLQAARDPHATISIAQPISGLLQQDGTFSHSQATTPQILGRPSAVPRP